MLLVSVWCRGMKWTHETTRYTRTYDAEPSIITLSRLTQLKDSTRNLESTQGISPTQRSNIVLWLFKSLPQPYQSILPSHFLIPISHFTNSILGHLVYLVPPTNQNSIPTSTLDPNTLDHLNIIHLSCSNSPINPSFTILQLWPSSQHFIAKILRQPMNIFTLLNTLFRDIKFISVSFSNL